MEKLLRIVSMTENPLANKDLLLTYKIPYAEEVKDSAINFCIRCFDGQFEMLYHSKKGWGLKCRACSFRVSALEKAG